MQVSYTFSDDGGFNDAVHIHGAVDVDRTRRGHRLAVGVGAGAA